MTAVLMESLHLPTGSLRSGSCDMRTVFCMNPTGSSRSGIRMTGDNLSRELRHC